MERERIIELNKRLRVVTQEIRAIRDEIYNDVSDEHGQSPRWYDIAVGRLESAYDSAGSAEIALGVAYDIKYVVEG